MSLIRYISTHNALFCRNGFTLKFPRQHRSAYEIFTPALTFRSFLFWSKTLLLCRQYSVRDINSDNFLWSRLRALSRIVLSWLATSPCVSLSVSLSQVPLPVHCNQHLEVCTLGAIFKTPSLELPLRQGWGKMLMILITWTRSPQHPPLSPQDWLLALPPGGHQAHQSSSHNCTTTTTCRRCAPHWQIY